MSDLGVQSNPTEALNDYLGVGGSTPSDYSSNILANRSKYAGVQKIGQRQQKAANTLARFDFPVPGGGGLAAGPDTQVQGKLAADRSGWQGFQGGPKQVRTAIDVIPSKKLNRWLIANGHDIEHLNPVFARHLIRLAKASGDPIQVTSGYRSVEDQAAIDPGTNPKAPPGLSSHQFGMALDADFTDKQADLASQFGLEHGQGGPGVADPPHTELVAPGAIKKAARFAPIRSGYAPPGVPLSEGDLGNWSSAGTGSYTGGAGAAGGSLGGGSVGGGGTGGGGVPGAGAVEQAPISAPPLYSPRNRTGTAASPASPSSVSDIANTLEAILAGETPQGESVLEQLLSGRRRRSGR
jgi:hypothetical protein